MRIVFQNVKFQSKTQEKKLVLRENDRNFDMALFRV